MTVALLVQRQSRRFTVEGLCPGNCSDTGKTSPKKSLWGMEMMWITHNVPGEHFSARPGASLGGRDGHCLCTLPWGKPRRGAALCPVLQRSQLLPKFCIDIPAAGVQVAAAERGQGLIFPTADATMASPEIKNLLICPYTFEWLHQKEYHRQQGSKRVT